MRTSCKELVKCLSLNKKSAHIILHGLLQFAKILCLKHDNSIEVWKLGNSQTPSASNLDDIMDFDQNGVKTAHRFTRALMRSRFIPEGRVMVMSKF